jgi:hypothetical protein
VAPQLGIKVNVNTAKGLIRHAKRYAADYRPAFRQPVFEGCLMG